MKKTLSILCILLAFGALTNLAYAESEPHENAHVENTAHAAETMHAEADDAALSESDAHASHDAHGEDIGLFTPDPGSSIWSIVLFILLLIILGKFAWPPILKGLQDRENKITNDLREAQTAAEKASTTLKEYEAKLAAAQGEAKLVIDQARADAQKTANELKEQTRNEIQQMKNRAEKDIEAAKEQSLNEIYAQTASITTEIAGRILRREINEADQQSLIEQSLTELTQTNN